jgi:hypothetical protein
VIEVVPESEFTPLTLGVDEVPTVLVTELISEEVKNTLTLGDAEILIKVDAESEFCGTTTPIRVKLDDTEILIEVDAENEFCGTTTAASIADIEILGLDDSDCLAVEETIMLPPTLNPSDALYAVHAEPENLKLHGSTHGVTCRKTGQFQVVALAAIPHLIVIAPPPWLITRAYRVAPAGTTMGTKSVIVFIEYAGTTATVAVVLLPAISANGAYGLVVRVV